MTEEKKKYEKLQEILRAYKKLAVAFSGGVDSSFLLKAAHDTLGEEATAITVSACVFPEREKEEARAFCEKNHVRQLLCELDPLSIPGFAQNPPDRCYICKKEILGRIRDVAEKQGIFVVAEGSNTDDDGDYRPGMLAVKELGVKSPLKEAGLSKAEIRRLSREMGLSTWNKPSCACLASRFVYGERVDKEKLGMVEKAEQKLSCLGFSQARVRIHGRMARIEVLPEDIERAAAAENREQIIKKFRELGFTYIAVDLLGYRTGSMNETL